MAAAVLSCGKASFSTLLTIALFQGSCTSLGTRLFSQLYSYRNLKMWKLIHGLQWGFIHIIHLGG